jgi:succinate dehydrogenase / fumarate reductase cytochrome b subunit
MPRKDLVSYSAKVGYRKHPGMLMWLLHRVTGVALGLFLIFHMLGVADVLGLSKWVGTLPIAGLIKASVAVMFVFHTANGFRIMLMEFCNSSDRKKFMPHLIATLGVVAVVGGILAFKNIVG